MLSEKVKAQKWGTMVLEQIAIDLQKNLPGLRSFSCTYLKKMRQFYEAFPNFEIGPSVMPQIENAHLSTSGKGSFILAVCYAVLVGYDYGTSD